MDTPDQKPPAYDVCLVGGGLSNCLTALAILHRQPDLRLALVESNDRLCGRHTWSFHRSDVPASARDFVHPILDHSWNSYEVRFPGLRRTVDLGYATILSESLCERVEQAFEQSGNADLFLSSRAETMDRRSVTLTDGRTLNAGLVIDARGPAPPRFPYRCGFQKFVGVEARLDRPLARRPILMDATVEQVDGYRFLYVLPFEEDRCLVEDTYFSDDPSLETATIRLRIDRYLESHGTRIRSVIREEQGVLPMPWRHEPTPAGDAFIAGYRGGFFHPGTGYSFPIAVRVADFVATHLREGIDSSDLRRLRRSLTLDRSFCHLLNWMLFRTFEPENRWSVFERFYHLPEETIARFYAMRMTARDRLRILWGKPPRGMSWTRPLRIGVGEPEIAR